MRSRLLTVAIAFWVWPLLILTAQSFSPLDKATAPAPQTATIHKVSHFEKIEPAQSRLILSEASNSDPQQAEAARLLVQGVQQFQNSQYPAALETLQQALAMFQAIENRQGEVDTLYTLSVVYRTLSQYQTALEVSQQALEIAREINYPQGEASALSGLGLAYYTLGQYSQAISFHQQHLDLARATGERLDEAAAFSNLGLVHDAIGQYSQALDLYRQALEIVRDIEDRQGEADILGNIGLAFYSLESYQQAIEFHQQNLEITRQIRDRLGEANALGNLGITYTALEQPQQAIEFHQQALAIDRDIENRLGEAASLSSLGMAYESLDKYQQAIEFHQQALAIRRAINDREGEAISLSSLGIAFIELEQFAEAEQWLTQSIEVFESLRTDLTDAQLIAIAETQAFAYTALEIALAAQGKSAAALEVTERARARAFVLQLARLGAPLPQAISEAIQPPSIDEIQQIARDQNTTLVSYSHILDQALYIWVVQPSGEVTFRTVEFDGADDAPNPIATIDGPVYRGRSTPSEITTLVADSRSGISEFGRIPSAQLKALYQILIEPIADLLPTAPEDEVVFIPQGNLFLVSFAALQDAEGAYLIENHTVLTAPAIQVVGLTMGNERREWNTYAGGDALVVGNPVMPTVSIPTSDRGLREAQLTPLPGAEAEAVAIGDFLNSSPLIGDQATEAQIKQQLPTAPLIHLATHGLLEYGDPQASGVLDLPGALALTPGDGEDGLLTAGEILDMDLQAELAVLSACDTGRGRITGDGVVGLSRSLITAGVPSAIVSLWLVPDGPTVTLMTEFYNQLQQGQTKAQALRQAMLATLDEAPQPVNWAAFILVGAVE
ncbi:MAG: CHAT domain-containing protein [Cyanobacteria bacterium P01_G01_bin.38]